MIEELQDKHLLLTKCCCCFAFSIPVKGAKLIFLLLIKMFSQDEPHAKRRRQILAKHPRVKSLFGPDQSLPFVLPMMALFQTLMAILCKDSGLLLFLLQAYLVGGTISHSLMLGIHECTHGLAFGLKKPFANRLLALAINLPLCLPLAAGFKKYHAEHHKQLGDVNVDADVPTDFECRLFRGPFGKACWLALQPICYVGRALIAHWKPIGFWELANGFAQLAFDALFYLVFGLKPLLFLLVSFWLGQGLHPMAAHILSEHFLFNEKHETYSYYGPMNFVAFNVGYHVEHHDFPYVAGKNLPKLHDLAYSDADALDVDAQHRSWLHVLSVFIFSPNITLASRKHRMLTAEQNLQENQEEIIKKSD